MKKQIKRLLIILLAVLVAVQAPFIYRRYKIGQLAERVAQLNKMAAEDRPAQDSKYKEYKGIIHAHTSLGVHSTGSFDELIAAANANSLDFVVMTEHWSDAVDTAALTLNGVYGRTLFIGGNEIDTANDDRFLMIPGSAEASSLRRMPTDVVLHKLHAENRLAIVTYPEKLRSWNADFDGIEVFSLHTNAKKMNPFTALFDAIWSYPAYPALMLASYFKRPDENLRRFDEIRGNRDIRLFAGTGAHSNIGLHLFGDDTGNKGLNIKIDDYDTIFRLARQHVLLNSDVPLTRETVLTALKSESAFIGFDVLAETEGFRFERVSLFEGGIAPNLGGLRVSSPLPARIVVFRNGNLYKEERDRTISELDVDSGIYRVEVYLDQLGPPFDKMPWIISNPIEML